MKNPGLPELPVGRECSYHWRRVRMLLSKRKAGSTVLGPGGLLILRRSVSSVSRAHAEGHTQARATAHTGAWVIQRHRPTQSWRRGTYAAWFCELSGAEGHEVSPLPGRDCIHLSKTRRGALFFCLSSYLKQILKTLEMSCNLYKER